MLKEYTIMGKTYYVNITISSTIKVSTVARIKLFSNLLTAEKKEMS